MFQISRRFLDSLLPPQPSIGFPPPTSPAPPNPLQPPQKPLLLTLHCLFPNELLPALDLLDRRLVTQFIDERPRSSEVPALETAPVAEGERDAEQTRVAPNPPPPPRQDQKRGGSVYNVRSSHQSRSRFASKRSENTTAEGMSYEVRLQAWNCSCAAFAFAAFSGEWDGASESENNRAASDGEGGGDGEEVVGAGGWGGKTLGHGVPICKHLLACVLAERVEGLAAFVEEYFVSREEMAGLAAGWAG